MSFKHLFKVKLNWFLNKEEPHATFKKYSKSHTIAIEGKEILNVSAAKAFKGDPQL